MLPVMDLACSHQPPGFSINSLSSLLQTATATLSYLRLWGKLENKTTERETVAISDLKTTLVDLDSITANQII